MKKILTGSLVVLAGVVSAPVVSPLQSQDTPAADYRNDPRADAVRRFFKQADCPAQHYSDAFVEAADDYDLDWRLLPSISYVESTGGKAARGNNLFGWDSGRAEFPTPTAGIHTVGYRLSHSELYRDKDLDEILATYNPNADYAERVKSVMRRIAPRQ
jgi:hypothetical protein